MMASLKQIDTNSGVKRESSAGNASLSQLLLTSPFGSNDGARFTANDVLGQPSTHAVDDVGSSAAPAGEVHTVLMYYRFGRVFGGDATNDKLFFFRFS